VSPLLLPRITEGKKGEGKTSSRLAGISEERKGVKERLTLGPWPVRRKKKRKEEYSVPGPRKGKSGPSLDGGPTQEKGKEGGRGRVGRPPSRVWAGRGEEKRKERSQSRIAFSAGERRRGKEGKMGFPVTGGGLPTVGGGRGVRGKNLWSPRRSGDPAEEGGEGGKEEEKSRTIGPSSASERREGWGNPLLPHSLL